MSQPASLPLSLEAFLVGLVLAIIESPRIPGITLFLMGVFGCPFGMLTILLFILHSLFVMVTDDVGKGALQLVGSLAGTVVEIGMCISLVETPRPGWETTLRDLAMLGKPFFNTKLL